MSRVCTICTHPQRAAIDAARAIGESSNRRIAAQYRLAESSVRRHAATHLPVHLVKAAAVEEVAQADDLLDLVRKGLERSEKHIGLAEGLIGRAVQQDDLRTAVAGCNAATTASREVRGCLELLAKLRGELDESPRINVLVSPGWLQVRSALLSALLPYPDARVAVAASLATLEVA